MRTTARTFTVPGVVDLEVYEPGEIIEASWVYFKGDHNAGPQPDHPIDRPFNVSTKFAIDMVRDDDTSKVLRGIMREFSLPPSRGTEQLGRVLPASPKSALFDRSAESQLPSFGVRLCAATDLYVCILTGDHQQRPPPPITSMTDLYLLFPPQNKSKVVKRALPAPKSLHIQLPQLLVSHLQQRLDKMRLPESDIQKNAVGLEDAVDLPSNRVTNKK